MEVEEEGRRSSKRRSKDGKKGDRRVEEREGKGANSRGRGSERGKGVSLETWGEGGVAKRTGTNYLLSYANKEGDSLHEPLPGALSLSSASSSTFLKIQLTYFPFVFCN